MSILYSPATLGPLKLQNHLVMAPMTRNRATGNVPNDLIVEYYQQRSSAGLIVTDGGFEQTAPQIIAKVATPGAAGRVARRPAKYSARRVALFIGCRKRRAVE